MKIFGLGVFSLSFLNTLIVVFVYRDVSIPLLLMFLVTLVSLTLGIYLINKNALYESNFEPDADDFKVGGLFTITVLIRKKFCMNIEKLLKKIMTPKLK